MSKSAIYSATTVPQTIAAGGAVSLGQTVHKCGCGIESNDGRILLHGTGYYSVTITMSVTPAAAGDVTLTLMQDGIAVPGAVTIVNSTTAKGATIEAIVRIVCPRNANSVLTVVSDTAASVLAVSAVVERL